MATAKSTRSFSLCPSDRPVTIKLTSLNTTKCCIVRHLTLEPLKRGIQM